MFNVIEMRKVIRAVELAEDSEFNMDIWSNQCQTVGCAIGNYIIRYQPEGFKFSNTSCNCERCQENGTELRFNNNVIIWPLLEESGVLEYFGISKKEFIRLFSSDEYFDKSRKSVLSRIQKFVVDKILEYHAQLPKKTIVKEFQHV